MTDIHLAPADACTGCGACAFRCPKSCITMQPSSTGIVLPVLDSTACIGCHSCEKVCPVLNMPGLAAPVRAWAAWSSREEERLTSASGGVAAEMYGYAVERGWLAVGASQNADFSVTHKVAVRQEDLPPFKNSKYVFSTAYDVFSQIKVALRSGREVVFIGLPCQAAALRKLFHAAPGLLVVEVVCHGTTPHAYLKQHVDMLARRAGRVAERMSFRDPYTYTYTYTFTLYDAEGRRFYAKRTKDGDTYQFGYHRAVSYRENCYHCHFARRERVADVTIADYHGLGALAPCPFDDRNVSLILENTPKGSAFIARLRESGRIAASERPLEEPFAGEPQLRHPSRKTRYRRLFERDIVRHGGDFEQAIRRAQMCYRREAFLRRLLSLPARGSRKMMKLLRTMCKTAAFRGRTR